MLLFHHSLKNNIKTPCPGQCSKMVSVGPHTKGLRVQFLVKGTFLVAGWIAGSGWGSCGWQPIDVSVCLLSFHSLNINGKMSSGED